MDINLSRTILEVYRYLPRVTYVYDKIIQTRAHNSAYSTTANCAFNDVMVISNFILTLSERKITLINLKIITEKALKTMDTKLARMLILKFVDGKKCADIAARFKISLRTYFRKINNALNSFSKALLRLGYGANKLIDMLKNENWIIETYNDLKEQKNIETISDNFEFGKQIKSNIIFELKKVSAFS